MWARSIFHGPSTTVYRLTPAQRAHDVERGLEARRPLAQGGAEHAELLLARADRALHDERALGDRGEGADLFREQHRMPQRKEEQRPRRSVVPLGEQATEHGDVLVVGHRDVVVIADEEAVEARLRGSSRPLDHPPGADARIHRRVSTPQRHADVHGSLAAPSWLRCARTILIRGASRDDERMATLERDLTALAERRAELRERYLRPAEKREPSNGGGVHHLALICADPEPTIAFYQDVLGFPLVELFENRDYEGSSHFFFDIGAGNMLAFFDFPGLGLEPVPEGLGGVQHVAISVTPETFEKLKSRLDDAGVAYIGPDRGIKESVYFKDPDGIQVELIRQPLMEVPESAPQEG